MNVDDIQRKFSPDTVIFNDDDDRDTFRASKPKTVVITGLLQGFKDLWLPLDFIPQW